MKLLESSRFEALNSALSFETGDSKICARIESYSCKMIGSEKALYKKWNGTGSENHREYEALSPPGQTFMGGSSPSTYMRNVSWSSEEEDGSNMINGFSNCSILCDIISRKTLFHLISTLNAAFPGKFFFQIVVYPWGKGEELMQDQSAMWECQPASTLTSKISSEQMVRLPHCPSFQGFVE